MLKILKWILILLISFIAFCNIWIIVDAREYIVCDSRELIGTEVGLVFGTSNRLINGNPNPFFNYRLETTVSLINSGKVEKLVLSGSKDSVYYDEAENMKKVLLQKGVDENLLILDKFGNRTIESITRLRDVHGYSRCIMVTQEYHAYRCVFIARKLGIDTQCLVADTPDKKEHFWIIFRELFARTKAVIDLYIIIY